MANRYWVGGAGSWSDASAHWATTSGGSPGGGNLPASTDNAFFDGNSALNDYDTITCSSSEITDISFDTGLSLFYTSGSLIIHGHATFEAALSLDAVYFQPSSANRNLTTNACLFNANIEFESAYSTVLVGDIYMGSTLTMYIKKGGFDANDYNITTGNVYISNTDQSAGCTVVTMGSGTWTCQLGEFQVLDTYPDTDTNGVLEHTGITINCETSTIKLMPDYNGASYATGAFGYSQYLTAKTFYKLELYSSYESTVFNLYGGGIFNEIKATPNAHAMTINFEASNFDWRKMYKVTTWTVSGSSGKLITVNSTGSTVPGLLWKSTGTVSSDYLDLSDSYAIDFAINQSHYALDETGDMGYTSVNEKTGQSFTPDVTGDIHSWVMYLAAVGTPVDALRIKIYTNSAGAPNTLLATSSNTIDPSGAAYGYCKFDFAAGTSLTSSTKYWAVLERTGSTSTTNYWNFYRSSASGYAGGEAIKHDGSSWGADTGDWYFQYNIRSAGAAWYAGTHSNDTSNNEGWVFSAPLTTTTKTITGVSRIGLVTNKTITGTARITATTARTITGVASVDPGFTTTTKTITGVSRIQLTTTKTITGQSRIELVTSQTESGVARITANATKTISGVSRVGLITDQTISGVSRIQLTTTKTETGISRITANADQTISGVSRITANTTNTETGVARIQLTTTKTIDGVSRISLVATQTITGVSRITTQPNQTISGISRITANTTKTESGVSRITANASRTIAGVSRITANTTKTISGVSRVGLVTSKTITGTSRIQTTATKTISGVSRIALITSKLLTGLSRITANATKTISGVARIQKTTTNTITGVSRVTVTQSTIISGVSRITKYVDATESGVARITANTAQTITGTAAVAIPATTQDITGISRITAQAPQTITGTSKIKTLTWHRANSPAWETKPDTTWQQQNSPTWKTSNQTDWYEPDINI